LLRVKLGSLKKLFNYTDYPFDSETVTPCSHPRMFLKLSAYLLPQNFLEERKPFGITFAGNLAVKGEVL